MAGLYFTLDDIVYHPGEAVIITDIGRTAIIDNAGTSLVCVTSNVNTECCRGSDGPGGSGGRVGEWYFPNGTIVPRQSEDPSADFTRTGSTNQVRLNRRRSAVSPTGIYECRVPDSANASVIVTAQITVGERACGVTLGINMHGYKIIYICR